MDSQIQSKYDNFASSYLNVVPPFLFPTQYSDNGISTTLFPGIIAAVNSAQLQQRQYAEMCSMYHQSVANYLYYQALSASNGQSSSTVEIPQTVGHVFNPFYSSSFSNRIETVNGEKIPKKRRRRRKRGKKRSQKNNSISVREQ